MALAPGLMHALMMTESSYFSFSTFPLLPVSLDQEPTIGAAFLTQTVQLPDSVVRFEVRPWWLPVALSLCYTFLGLSFFYVTYISF